MSLLWIPAFTPANPVSSAKKNQIGSPNVSAALKRHLVMADGDDELPG